ncbi:MAG: hypothetical protein JWP87_1099 [Labilithrix sp.]|nr:hypothetical protein [Labilithrix sp.]
MTTKNLHRTSVLRSASRRAPASKGPARARRRVAFAAAPAPSIDSIAAPTLDLLRRVAAASSSLALGFEVTARNAREERFAEETAWLAALHRSLSEEIAAAVGSAGLAPPRTKPTCGERLRWEWLASAGRLIDGASDARLVAECARIQREADGAAASLIDDPLARAAPTLRRMLAALERVRAAGARVARTALPLDPVVARS